MNLAGVEFGFIAFIRPERMPNGELLLYNPASGYKRAGADRLNAYGSGQFYRFSVPEAPSQQGVYAIVVDNSLAYIGRCENLRGRFGRMQYDSISPKICYVGGQSTNCKINALVASWASENKSVGLWFATVSEKPARDELERSLIVRLRPPHNSQFLS